MLMTPEKLRGVIYSVLVDYPRGADFEVAGHCAVAIVAEETRIRLENAVTGQETDG